MSLTLSQPRRRPVRRGFSLVEAAFVTMIAGLVTVGTLQLVTAGTYANQESSELTTAVNLAENIHEYTMTLPFKSATASAGVLDLNNASYSPPIDAGGRACTELGSAWRQSISVKPVDPTNLSTVQPTPNDKTARVTVTVYRNNNAVTSLSWVAANTVPQ